MSGATNFQNHAKGLSPEAQQTGEILLKAGQAHVFDGWTDPEADLKQKEAFLAQVAVVHKGYPGGLQAYIDRARTLLEAARSGANPYEGYAVTEPTSAVRFDSPEDFDKYERLGMTVAGNTAFVLVAGGLGERLGYSGIKISLPSEITSGKPYIQLYCEHIVALQERARKASGDSSIKLQLGIMTSDDTNTLTVALLEKNNYFGIKDQITVFKQGKVPSLQNNDGKFVVSSKDPYLLETKPHGHGDVHMLLYMEGIAEKWVKSGVKYICFFQDTNGLVFRALPGALGVSVEQKLQVNSVTVPRMPGEEVGAICTLTREEQKEQKAGALPSKLTINVEYNQIKGLMAGKEEPTVEGGKSAYPGNINVLVFSAPEYVKVLAGTQGVITEFVNPKYKDSERTTFKKPTRLECMMQDYPKLLGSEAAVGFSQFERWTSFSAVKNQIEVGATKQAAGNAPEVAASGESDAYRWARIVLKEAKVNIEDEKEVTYSGVKVPSSARIVLAPSFGVTQNEVKSKFSGTNTISGASSLILEGSGITSIKNLTLDGALIIRAAPGAVVTVEDLTIKNKAWSFEEIGQDSKVDESLIIRGYTLKKTETAEFVFGAGTYVLSDKTKEQYARTSDSTSQEASQEKDCLQKSSCNIL